MPIATAVRSVSTAFLRPVDDFSYNTGNERSRVPFCLCAVVSAVEERLGTIRRRSVELPLNVVFPTGGRASVVRLLLTMIFSAAAAAAFFPNAGAQTQTATMALSPEDTFINVNASVYSAQTTLNVYTWPDQQAANAIVMKFNLSALPTGAVIERAVLRLALLQADARTSSGYRVTAHKLIGANPDVGRATGSTAGDGR